MCTKSETGANHSMPTPPDTFLTTYPRPSQLLLAHCARPISSMLRGHRSGSSRSVCRNAPVELTSRSLRLPIAPANPVNFTTRLTDVRCPHRCFMATHSSSHEAPRKLRDGLRAPGIKGIRIDTDDRLSVDPTTDKRLISTFQIRFFDINETSVERNLLRRRAAAVPSGRVVHEVQAFSPRKGG